MSYILGSPPQPRWPAPEKQAPKTSGFENQWELHLWELASYRKQRLAHIGYMQNFTHSKSQHSGSSLKGVLLILQSLPEGKEATGNPPGDKDTGSSHFGELILPLWYQCWKLPFGNPPTNLLAPRTDLPTHQWAGSSLTSPRQHSQPWWDPAPHTSGLAGAPIPPGIHSQPCRKTILPFSRWESLKKTGPCSQLHEDQPHLPVPSQWSVLPQQKGAQSPYKGHS